ncbi:DUF1827 family protein [Lapidilactobacillus mulanensis]|uniref:DUF1827 family protein n=1 Tax=Lapidilactobacillus mulanensis TaxID=2485999 RepID=A0ABW4DMY0_9LACO|nr:DUF1827 family protein [Lapidilactobacillus mulanensis]
MRLFDVTNNFSKLVQSQLSGTDANLVKVYSLGNIIVVFTKAPAHEEILLKSEHRNIRNDEIEFAIKELTAATLQQAEVIHGKNIAEISIKAG